MPKERVGFCVECRKETTYHLRKVVYKKYIKEKEYEFEIIEAVCDECGQCLTIPGLMDTNAAEIDRQYRLQEGIVSVSDVQNLMDVYKIGKAPLSLALGFGEITITRYLAGQMPSKEYSDVIRRALESPAFMVEKLQQYKEKVGETAYKKSMQAVNELESLFTLPEKMLITISYIFKTAGEVTPLALQKMLYFIQGVHMVLFDTALFQEDCQAWVQGPVYTSVYEEFKSFKYNPIEDTRFSMFQNRFHELSDNEKKVVDLVLDSFGMYSGKTLEKITHNETPWKEARANILPYQCKNEVIPKAAIQEYFKKLSETYDFGTVQGIREYITSMLKAA